MEFDGHNAYLSGKTEFLNYLTYIERKACPPTKAFVGKNPSQGI
jgi:hypothetical protein